MDAKGAAGHSTHGPPGAQRAATLRWPRLRATCALSLFAAAWLEGLSWPSADVQAWRRLHDAGRTAALTKQAGALKGQADEWDTKVDQKKSHADAPEGRGSAASEAHQSTQDATDFEQLEKHDWSGETFVVALVVFVLCGVCFFFCFCAGLCQLLNDRAFCCTPEGYFLLDDPSVHVEQVIVREMRLAMLLYPLIPLLGAAQTTCEEGSPPWVYAVFTPLLIRSKYIEWLILKKLEGQDFKPKYLPFMMGTLDSLDWVTDGMFPIQAYKCDGFATADFAESFCQSWAWPLALLVWIMHFYGLAYMALMVSGTAQHYFGGHFPGCAADAQGWATVSRYYEEVDQNEEGSRQRAPAFLTMFSRVLLENCLQLWLQASFVGLVFDRVSSSGRQKALISIVMGVLSAGKSVMTLWTRAGNCTTKVVTFPVALIALGMIAWTAAKIFYAYHCESHLWNLSTLDCVHSS